MSAIEVLKGIKNTEIVVEDIAFNLLNEGYPHEEKDINDALGEAIVALEQKEELIKIAKERIEILDKEKIEFLDNMKGREYYTIMNRQERKIWKEVLERVGE